jgi:hypothetical protein
VIAASGLPHHSMRWRFPPPGLLTAHAGGPHARLGGDFFERMFVSCTLVMFTVIERQRMDSSKPSSIWLQR